MHRPVAARCSALALLLATIAAQAPPANGPRQVDARWHALTHVTLVPQPGRQLDDATVVLRDGLITEILESGAATPPGASVHDGSGLWVYAGLIEPYLAVDAPKLAADAPGAHWNANVQAQRSPLEGAGVPAEVRRELRALGFAAAAVSPPDGLFRGSGAVVLLDDPAAAEDVRQLPVVRDRVYHSLSFTAPEGGYPGSLMGCIALIRQTLHDADWYARSRTVYAAHPERLEPLPTNRALEALGDGGAGSPPLLFDTSDELDALRAVALAREFGRPCILLGSGREYARLAALAEEKVPVLVPLTFPEPPAVDSFAGAETVSLRELMQWEQAPTNPRRLVQAGVKVALTTARLEKRTDFRDHLRQALRHGLLERQALAMLTTQPAEILGVADKLGTVAAGRIANLLVTDGPLFAEKTRIRAVWVRGRRHVIEPAYDAALTGDWDLSEAPFAATLKIGTGKQPTVELIDAAQAKLKGRKVSVRERDIVFVVDSLELGGAITAQATLEGETLRGNATLPDGTRVSWSGARSANPPAPPADEATTAVTDVPEILPTPLGAFGITSLPAQENLLIKNATVWLPDRVLEDGALLVRDGRIAWVGAAAQAPEPAASDRVLVARGKHVTAGLIDCHSHTGISGGVNEGTQAVTAEVRIGDVIDPDDIGWYRELAGGLTAVNQLHGSANPIGGQNSVVKLRWGALRGNDMSLAGAPGGIKFALGENVKRSNSGAPNDRYPNSRMGVEALLLDRFTAARDYAQGWKRWQELDADARQQALPPRRDLELDALVDILHGQRLVHCHSYRQDEILMLCRVARDFGFKIGTFQHVLEGYKVAEAVKTAALGASSFSDWWAYKYEVVDAIPENGAIMHDVGVVVSFNSDSGELARRMNTEAAKAARYGGVPPAQALGFVTLNPAIQLGVEDRIGSLAAGKDADFVIWSGDPLSTLSRCEATFIDGRRYFSLEQDAELRTQAKRERTRLVQKLLAEKEENKKDGKGKGEDDKAEPRWGDWLWGANVHQAGECGCGEFHREHGGEHK